MFNDRRLNALCWPLTDMRQHFCSVQVSNIANMFVLALPIYPDPSKQFGKQLPQNLLKPFISTNVQLMATCVAFLHSWAIFFTHSCTKKDTKLWPLLSDGNSSYYVKGSPILCRLLQIEEQSCNKASLQLWARFMAKKPSLAAPVAFLLLPEDEDDKIHLSACLPANVTSSKFLDVSSDCFFRWFDVDFEQKSHSYHLPISGKSFALFLIYINQTRKIPALPPKPGCRI